MSVPDASHAPRHTTGSIAASLGAELIGPSHLPITGVDALDTGAPGTLTFIRSHRFASRWPASKASAALISRQVERPVHDPAHRALLIVDDADLAMISVLRLFSPSKPSFSPGIHPTAIVDGSAVLGHGVYIGPNCIIGPETTIGDGSVLVASVHLGEQVSIGAICTLHPGVIVLDRCSIGDACILWPRVTIGADGFGYHPAPDGRGLIKIPHIGSVRVGNQVEIGAGSCIDRGKFGATTIGDGTKIDNIVQIGHNVRVGRSCIICGVTGIAGSVTIADGVTVAGGVGIADNLAIGPRATIAAMAGVISDVPAGETYFGSPAGPYKEMMRAFAALRKLSDHMRAVKRLGKLAAHLQAAGADHLAGSPHPPPHLAHSAAPPIPTAVRTDHAP